jgi:hypothetical protein
MIEVAEARRVKLSDILRRKAIATDAAMLQRMDREQRLDRLDAKMQDLNEMFEATTHPRLKALLANELVKLNNARVAIQ